MRWVRGLIDRESAAGYPRVTISVRIRSDADHDDREDLRATARAILGGARHALETRERRRYLANLDLWRSWVGP